ncbi:MAG: hypothetical protein ACLPXB_09575 [Thiobacillaceae bacterium]
MPLMKARLVILFDVLSLFSTSSIVRITSSGMYKTGFFDLNIVFAEGQ